MIAMIPEAGAVGAQREASGSDGKAGASKLKIALGAASLFLFIVGIKRSLHTEHMPREQAEKADGLAVRERSRAGA